MSGNMRQLDIWIMPLPPKPITSTDAACHDLDHHTIPAGCRITYLLNFRFFRKGSVQNCFHSVEVQMIAWMLLWRLYCTGNPDQVGAEI